MQGAATAQFNIPLTTSYSFLFTEWTGKKKDGQVINPSFAFEDRKRLSSSMLLMLADIREGSAGRARPKLMKHQYFMDKFGLCKKTVMKNLAELEDRGLIEKCGRSRYRVIVNNLSKSYILIEDFYFGQKWQIGEVAKRLTFSAVIAIEYIISMYLFMKEQGKPFVRSQKKLAAGLNFAPSTMGDALKELVDAKLLKRYKATPVGGYTDNIEDTEYIIDYTEEGVGDGYSLTAFKPDDRLLAFRQQLEEGFKRKLEGELPPEQPDVGAFEAPKRQERSQKKGKKEKLRKLSQSKRKTILPEIYRLLRERKQRAEYRADRLQDTVFDDPTCREIYRKLNGLTLPIARASIDGNVEEEKRLTAMQAELQKDLDVAVARRLKELGKTIDDLQPQYTCRLCNDTGADPKTGKPCRCVSAELAKIGYKL